MNDRSKIRNFLEHIKRKDNYIVTENEVNEFIKLAKEIKK